MEETKTVKITQVVVFQPDNKPAIFNVLSDDTIAKINAGMADGVTRVSVERKDGRQTIFMGMAYTIEVDPEKK